jgi:outer membrane protein
VGGGPAREVAWRLLEGGPGRNMPTPTLPSRRHRRISMLVLAVLSAAALPAQARRALSLQEALALARLRRSEIAQADVEVRLADLNTERAALSRFQLTLEGRLAAQVQRLYVNAPPLICLSLGARCNNTESARPLGLSAGLTVPIWSGFKLEAQGQQAELLLGASRAQKRSQVLAVDLETALVYWAARKQELLRKLAERTAGRAETIAKVTRARVEAGISPATDYKRAHTAALRARLAVDDLAAELERARIDLALALQIDEEVVLTSDPAASTPPLPPLDRMLADAAGNHPTLQAAAAQLGAAEQQVRAARADWRPQLSAFGTADASNEAFGVQHERLTANFVAGLALSWRLQGLDTHHAVRQADLERERTHHQAQRQQLQLHAQLRQAHSRLRRAMERREPLELAVSTARNTVELVQRRYDAGTALVLEVLTAEGELQLLEVAVIENSIELAEARALLDAARGSFD